MKTIHLLIIILVYSSFLCTSVTYGQSFSASMQVEKTKTQNRSDPEDGDPCPGQPTVTDSEGNVYNTVLIGGQCWMAENLNIGTMICGGYGMDQLNNGIIEKYCYNDDPNLCDANGGLYQWREMMDYSNEPGAQGICPDGWHIPTTDEWLQLRDYVGPVNGGQILKSCRQIDSPLGGDCDTNEHPRWNDDGTGLYYGIDDLNFSALPGGNRYMYGGFYNLGTQAYWWSSSEHNTYHSAYWSMGYNVNGLPNLANWYKEDGYSVRCVKTYTPEIIKTLNLNDISIPPDPDDCFAASSQITVSDFTVANGGSVTLVTGHSGKILLQEGTVVQNGGYLRAWIDVAGNYCDQPESMLATGMQDESLQQTFKLSERSQAGLKLYPNPTTGLITLEITDAETSGSISVQIFGIRGETIQQAILSGSHNYIFDLSGQAAGVYFLRLMMDGQVAFVKLIKQ
ncbi:MAG TPA: T9SS type A sorting domain-containing protein [Bacteroidales bacterium]|nr:T9SS type A sorting domain-containing protein [Bacteroidales bacterium]